MVLITIDLIRKRAEHNEGEVSTLEEIALHQEEIEKIEHIQNWCKDLQILYLQNNIISRIENLGKLKKLVYLNLALNNIEKIENLQGCESLEKLDLTLNFVGDLRDVCTLQSNYNLKHLFLLGNPCTDYEGYRDYVSTVLPSLVTLDGTDISRSERIIASQCFPYYKDQILQHYNEYRKQREKEKDDAKNRNVSLPNLEKEEEIREYLDTSYLDVDVQPTHVKVMIKGKIFQIVHDNEICIDKTTAKRSTTTGHLVITMPLLKVNEALKGKYAKETKPGAGTPTNVIREPNCGHCRITRREMLEIGPREDMDFSRIVENHSKGQRGAERSKHIPDRTIPLASFLEEKVPSADFVDDPDVPPLE
ncbi:dynein axonemal assembly factor 11 isoform X2 [Hetaerina americana]|uniref:dynein axonemal assembly factor 11 isoform X2 n=1 Tax=Hetaerina americana TaxID=62018 RepID=UPI003A7F5D14